LEGDSAPVAWGTGASAFAIAALDFEKSNQTHEG